MTKLEEIKLDDSMIADKSIVKEFLDGLKHGYFSIYYKAFVMPIVIKEKEDVIISMGLPIDKISTPKELNAAKKLEQNKDYTFEQFKTHYTTLWYEVIQKKNEYAGMQTLLDESVDLYKEMANTLLSK